MMTSDEAKEPVSENILARPADEFVNDPSIEMVWAIHALQKARVHFNLICSVDPRFLRLTDSDEEIYSAFVQEFGQDFPLQLITEEQIKSAEAKNKWRHFSERFKHIEDYSFGTLLRLDCHKPYDSENTLLVPKIQFLAIEIARNRNGCNTGLRDMFPAFHSIHEDN